MSQTEAIAKRAKSAFESSQLLDSSERIRALGLIKDALLASKDEIVEANKEDLQSAQLDVDAGRLSQSLLKRLDLFKGDKWESMIQGVQDVADLQDPNGRVTYASELDDGLELYRVSCPIGVLLVIFEARPEVVVNIAALAIKSGNAAILKGGKESSKTTAVLSRAIRSALSKTSLPEDYIQTVQTRDEISSLLQHDKYIDLVIPRGSNSLVRNIQNSTRIPVMGHADGLCSVFLDESAEESKAVRVSVDSKINYPAACNAAETLIVHSSLLDGLWPKVASALLTAAVELLCDDRSLSALKRHVSSPELLAQVKVAQAEDFDTEHLCLRLSVLTVDDINAAISHINSHSSHHTDCIVTESEVNATLFCRGVDSAGTFVNASTRFADGFRYGFGTEVGISTGRIHARGPVGLEGLVTYKYIVKSKGSNGHIVDEFGSESGKKQFKHRKIDTTSLPF